MEIVITDVTTAYKEAVASRAALGHELFGLLVKEEWYGMWKGALQKRELVDGTITHSFLDMPDFSHSATRDYHYIGCWQARGRKENALGERLSDERFLELVMEVLQDELDKYNVELHLETRHSNWDSSDQVLRVYPKA